MTEDKSTGHSLALAILDKGGFEKSMEAGLATMAGMQKQVMQSQMAALPPGLIDKYMVAFEKEIRTALPEIKNKQAELIAEHWNESELKRVTSLLESDDGQLYITGMSELQPKMMSISQELGTKVASDAHERASSFLTG